MIRLSANKITYASNSQQVSPTWGPSAFPDPFTDLAMRWDVVIALIMQSLWHLRATKFVNFDS